MEVKAEIRDFLSSRRARTTPEEAGLPVFGGARRFPGLRRGEAAMLAGGGVAYNTEMGSGRLGASPIASWRPSREDSGSKRPNESPSWTSPALPGPPPPRVGALPPTWSGRPCSGVAGRCPDLGESAVAQLVGGQDVPAAVLDQRRG